MKSDALGNCPKSPVAGTEPVFTSLLKYVLRASYYVKDNELLIVLIDFDSCAVTPVSQFHYVRVSWLSALNPS